MKKVMAVVLIDKDNCISFWERNNTSDFVGVGLFQQLKVSLKATFNKSMSN